MVSEGVWGVLVIVGPLVLLAALIWAMFNNKVSKRKAKASEQATRDLYASEDRDRDIRH